MSDVAGRPQAKRGRANPPEPAAGASDRGARGKGGRTRGRPKKRGTGVTSKSSRNSPRGDVDDVEHDLGDRDAPQEALAPVADPKATKRATTSTTDKNEEPGLDAEFLAALPPDIRAEIEATHKLEVLKKRQKAQETKEKAAQVDNAAAARGAAHSFEGQHHGNTANPAGKHSGMAGSVLEKPTLMGRREIGDLRAIISVWVQSTLVFNKESSDSAGGSSSKDGGGPLLDEGPNPDDVKSFSDFLTRVIVMERDLDRVRMVLRWLKRKVEENERLLAGKEALTEERRQLLEVQKIIVFCTWRQALNQTLSIVSKVVHRLYGGRFVLD